MATKKYMLKKWNDGSEKMTITDSNTKATATYYGTRLNKVEIGNGEVTYADGVNANCVILKDKNVTVTYDDDKVFITKGKQSIDPNSDEGKKLLNEAKALQTKTDKYTKEIANSKNLQKHKFTKELAEESKNKFNARVTAHAEAKKTKQKIAEGRRGISPKSEVNDPNLDVAMGRTPKYNTSGKAYQTPKQNRPTADNVDAMADDIIKKSKDMTDADVEERFDKQYGKGAYKKRLEIEQKRIAAARLKKQRGH